VASFQFKSTKKSFEVKDEKGEPLKTYYIDVGNVQTLKTIMTRFKVLQDKFESLKGVGMDESAVDMMVAGEKEIVEALLGDDWEILWAECGNNVFSMLQLVNALVSLVNDSLRERNEI
jgi:hypothetical protein